MRKLALILIGFIAIITFIRAFDVPAGVNNERINSDEIRSASMRTDQSVAAE